MLVNDKTTWVWHDHPSEPDVRFRLRLLTDDEYQQALDARFDQVIEKARTMGAELSKAFQDRASTPTTTETNASLHPATAIKFAVQEWSYNVDCNDENKAALDKATQDWLKGVIVDMNGPRPLLKSQPSDGSSNKGKSHLSSVEPIDFGRSD